LLDRGSSNKTARNAKFIVGWLSHLYYWVYPGVMVAMMGFFITYILSTVGIIISPLTEVAIVVLFAVLVGFIAFRGITGSTRTNLMICIAQIAMLVGVTGIALAYRFLNPQHVTFYYSNPLSVVIPSSASHMLFQATIAILVLVGFESVTALTAEARNPKDVPKAIILSLVIQGAFCYLLEYYGMQAWINSKYTFLAAAASNSPIGDMIIQSVNGLLDGGGFIMLVVAAVVATAVLGTTLSCMNTGVRVTYAISRDTEVPEPLGKLNPRYGTPAISIWVMTLVAAGIGAFGVLSLTNLRNYVFVQLRNFHAVRSHLCYSCLCAVSRTPLNLN
jgi:amino acid transporter